MFKNHNGCKTYLELLSKSTLNLKTQKTVRQLKDSWAVILQLALKLQKGNNFSVIPI